MNRKILLTFDYELFLKHSGTPGKCMLEPGAKILKTFKKHQIHGTFFIDVLYLWRLRETAQGKEVYKKIEQQIGEIIYQGNRVELHLHPHWIDAKRENGQWGFEDLRYYKFSNLEPKKAAELFQIGMEISHEITRKVDSSYQLNAFRAGGLCIQPFSAFKKLFQEHGIKVDSSVAPHLFTNTDAQEYDFRQAPDKDFYFFDEDPTKENPQGQFLQIPVSVYQRGIIEKIREKVIGKRGNPAPIFGDGKGLAPNAEIPPGFLARLRSALRAYPMTYSLDMVQPEVLVDKIKRSDRKIINVLSHPKLMTENSLKAISMLAQLDVAFKTVQDIYEEVAAR